MTRWIVKYKPPIENFIEEDVTTWPKVFYLDNIECPEELDLKVKINELKYTYNMEDRYITLECC